MAYTDKSHAENFAAWDSMLDQCEAEIARLDALGERATLTDARNLAAWLARKDALTDMARVWFADKGC